MWCDLYAIPTLNACYFVTEQITHTEYLIDFFSLSIDDIRRNIAELTLLLRCYCDFETLNETTVWDGLQVLGLIFLCACLQYCCKILRKVNEC